MSRIGIFEKSVDAMITAPTLDSREQRNGKWAQKMGGNEWKKML